MMICAKDISQQEYEQLKADNNNFKSEEDREVLE